MSATLQDTGRFASCKRRTGGKDSGLKQEENSVFGTDKTRELNDGFSAESSSLSSVLAGKTFIEDKTAVRGATSAPPVIVAGALAPKSVGNPYVQTLLHKELNYSAAGDRQVPEKTLKVFRFVEKAFVIPEGFEKDHKFSPLSGMSHELRVVSAFMGGQLEARSKTHVGVKMCLECGEKGHFPQTCPDIIL